MRNIILHGHETRTIGKYDWDEREAMEMLPQRRMIENRWIEERKKNKIEVDKVNEKKTMMIATTKIKIKLFERLLVHNRFIAVVTKEKINGKSNQGGPRKSFFEGIFQRIVSFTSYRQVKTTTSDRRERLQQPSLAFKSLW